MTAALDTLGAPWSQLDWQGPAPAMGGLSWLGCDTLIYSASTAEGAPVLAKVPRPHTSVIGHPASRVAALAAAGEAGLGPAVLASDAATGIVVQQAVAAELGTLLRIGRPGVLTAYTTARAAFRGLDVALEPRDVFDDIEALRTELARRGVALPGEGEPVYALLDRLRAAVADGPAPTPVWGSGEISNVLIGADARVSLVGGELVGLSDPLSDVGMILAELSPFVADDDEVMQLAWGDSSPGALGRARLYGIADDIRASLLSLLAHDTDPHSPAEFIGYLGSRLRRATATVASAGFDGWLADAAKGWK